MGPSARHSLGAEVTERDNHGHINGHDQWEKTNTTHGYLKKTMVVAKNHGIMGIEKKKNIFFDGDVGL